MFLTESLTVDFSARHSVLVFLWFIMSALRESLTTASVQSPIVLDQILKAFSYIGLSLSKFLELKTASFAFGHAVVHGTYIFAS